MPSFASMVQVSFPALEIIGWQQCLRRTNGVWHVTPRHQIPNMHNSGETPGIAIHLESGRCHSWRSERTSCHVAGSFALPGPCHHGGQQRSGSATLTQFHLKWYLIPDCSALTRRLGIRPTISRCVRRCGLETGSRLEAAQSRPGRNTVHAKEIRRLHKDQEHLQLNEACMSSSTGFTFALFFACSCTWSFCTDTLGVVGQGLASGRRSPS